MPNAGFRGAIVRIPDLTIRAGVEGMPVLQCTVQFAAEDGAVHAMAKHTFPLDADLPDDGLVAAAQQLLVALVRRVEGLHYTSPRDGGDEDTVLRGIAEVLASQEERGHTSDEPGKQG